MSPDKSSSLLFDLQSHLHFILLPVSAPGFASVHSLVTVFHSSFLDHEPHYYQHAKDRHIASPANCGILEDAYSVGGVFPDMMEVKHYFVFFLQLSKD